MAARKAFGVDESALGAGKQVAVEEPAAQAKDESEAELGAEGKVLSEAEGKAEVEAKEKAEVEAKEKAEAEAKEKKAEVEAKARLSKAEREARRKRRNAAKKAEREARERSEKEQKQAELPAPPVQMRSSASTQASLEESTDGRKDEAELRAQEAAEEEAEHAQMVEFDANKEKAELEAKEKAELEAKVKAELEAKEKAELEAKEKAELEAKKKTEAPAQKEKLSKEERDARRRERNAQKKAEREAQERASGVAKAEPQAALDAEMRVHVPSPRAAGCYLRLHDGCPLHPISSQAWHRVLAAKDFHECEVAKISMDSFCGHDKTSFYYIPGEVSMSPDEPGIDTSRLWTVTAKDLAAADAASIARATGAAVATTAELLNAVEIATSTMAPEDAASMASTTAGPPPEQASASGAAAQPLAGEQECRNAAQGEWCYRAVKYAMESGIGTHPERYPGLTKDSPFADFQTYFHKYGQASCQKPCPFEATAVEAATTQLVSPGGVMTSPMPSNREVPFQTITTTAPFLVDRVVADDAAGGSSTEIRESLLGGRRGSNADGPATGKPQEDDSALWLDALIQPQTGTEDSSGAAKDKLQQNASDGSTTADAADGSASTEGLHWDLGNSTDSPAATQDSTAAEQPETASEGIHWDLGDAATDVVGNSAPMESSTDETQPEKETSDDSAVWLDAVEKPEQGAADGSAAADDADDEDETAGAAESSTATVESLQDLWESPGPAQSSTAAGQPAQSAAADGPIAADGADSSASTQDTAAAEKDAAGDSGAWLAAAVSAETGGADGSAAADAADVQGVVSDSLASADGSAAASQVQRDASDDADIWLDAAEKPEAAAADSSAATESPNATERAEEGAEVTPDEEKAPARDAAVPPPIRQDAPPAHPSKPGCWLWMQGGCPRHPRQSLRDTWYRDRRGGLSHDTCERRMDSYQKFCGAVNMTFHFVASAPRSPKKAASPPPSVQSTREKFEDFEQKALEAVQKVVVTWTSPAPAAAAPPAPAGDVPGVPHGAPRLPSAPGCYLWTRGGCPKHPQRSKPASWQRDRRGFKDAFGCSQRRDTFDRYCGGNGTVFFYRSQASQDNASADPEPAPSELIPLNMSTGKYPQIPKEAGCYLWLHHGCPKHPHREYKSSWYNDRFGSDGWQACSERKDIFDRFCGTDSTVFKYIGAESAAGNTTAAAPSEEATPAPAAQEEPAAAPPSTTVAAPLDVPRVRPPVPREPGCYIWLTNGCPKHPHQEYRNDWMRDRSGHGSYTSCSYRKSVFDTFCGVDATVFAYVEETTSGMRVVSSSDPELDRAEIETGPSRQDSTDEAAAEAPSTTPVVPLGVSRWRSQIPQEPGCYVLLKSGCPNHPHKVYDGVWFADRSGQGSHDECTKRAGIFDAFCGVSDTATAYVVQGPTGLRIDSDGLGDEDAAATKPEPAADDANTTASEEDESDHPGEDVDGPKPELAAEGVNATAAEQDESDHPEEDVAAPQPEQANAAAEAQPEQEDVSFSHGDDEVGSDTGEDQPAEQAAAEEEWSDEALPVVADDAQGPEAAQRERRAQEARAAREADERAVREAEEESTREASQANEEKAERERALREDEERAEREAFERAERQLQEKAEAEGEAKAEASEAAAAEGPQGAASEGSGDEAYDKPLWDVSSAERNAFAKAAQAANEKAYEQTGHDAYEKAYEEATSAGEADTSDEVGDNASAYEKPVSNAELHELAKTVRKAKQRTGQEDAADEGANSTEECPLWCRSSRRAKQQSCSYARCSSCPMCASKEAEEGNVTGEAAAPARPLEAAGEAAEAAEVQTSEAESSPALPEETIDRAPEEASERWCSDGGGWRGRKRRQRRPTTRRR
ncbi:unnamed protein product [Prorocentrum cordatum]|uniref:Uncharacterized protein n=1 Tax=Prorocentrum cordatum TaxID=2364126 RepID=A0ABN9SV85_9DINO|nr:unnamed protein product [Polarella glacialis]